MTGLDFNPTVRKDTDFTPTFNWREYLLPSLREARARVSATIFIEGTDVSRYQGDIDFVLMYEAGYRFVVIKASEHTNWEDPKFQQNWQAAIDAGLIVMVYHFFRSNYDGRAQALHFLSVCENFLEAVDGKTIMFFDLESNDGVSNGTRINRLEDFYATITNAGYICGGYSSYHFWDLLAKDNGRYPSFSDDPDFIGWVASWTSRDLPTFMNGIPVDQQIFWQDGVCGKHSWVPDSVPGVPGNCDHNKFFGTLDQLKELIGIEDPPDPHHTHLEFEEILESLDDIAADLTSLKSTLETHLVGHNGWTEDIRLWIAQHEEGHHVDGVATQVYTLSDRQVPLITEKGERPNLGADGGGEYKFFVTGDRCRLYMKLWTGGEGQNPETGIYQFWIPEQFWPDAENWEANGAIVYIDNKGNLPPKFPLGQAFMHATGDANWPWALKFLFGEGSNWNTGFWWSGYWPSRFRSGDRIEAWAEWKLAS